jgi:hypothetical protein
LSDKEPEEIIDAELDKHPEISRFWIEYGKGIVNNTLNQLDERAKNMITVCASLIVVNFGLLLAFEVNPLSINVTPQFFFALSAAFFVLSYFPRKKEFHLDSPTSIEDSYADWTKWKLKWHYIGFGFFIAGLFAVAAVGLSGNFKET